MASYVQFWDAGATQNICYFPCGLVPGIVKREETVNFLNFGDLDIENLIGGGNTQGFAQFFVELTKLIICLPTFQFEAQFLSFTRIKNDLNKNIESYNSTFQKI